MASPHKQRAEMQTNTRGRGSRWWADMAPDVLANIFSRLPLKEFFSAVPCVCKPWLHASLHPLALPTLDLSELPFEATDHLLQLLLRRTEPHLCEFVFPHMNHPDWLQIVEKSAPMLQKLHIPYSCGVNNEWAINVAPLMTRITDLHVSTATGVQLSHEALEAFGKHCKHITHLRRNEEGLRRSHWQIMCEYCPPHDDPSHDDSAAFAIARNYPSLKHLELQNNLLSTSGLRAILDGCPMLEHLDLTGCVLRMDELLLLECRTRLRVFLEANYEKDSDTDEDDNDSDTDETSTDDSDSDTDETSTDDDDDDEDDDFAGLVPEKIGKPIIEKA